MWKKLLIIVVLLLICAAIGWQFFKPTPAIRVSAVKPTIQNLATILDLNAEVMNTQVVTITALLDGEIGQIKAREGMSVKAGQPLAELDNKRSKTLLEKANAELQYSEQKLNTASRTYTRLKNLSQAGNTSRQSLDDSLDALRSAQAALAIAKSDITLSSLQIQNATVSAPFDGVVIQEATEAGQWVEAGTPLFELAAKDGYLIEAQVDASDWALVSLNQSVTLSTESAPGKKWESQVAWIAPTIEYNDRDAKAVAIRFTFGDDAPPLLLGQEVDAELILEQADEALTLPLSAMIEREPDDYIVFLAVDGKAKLTPVSVGLQNNTHAQIIDGLTENDTVVSSRSITLEHDMPVEIQ